jgi:hypothetical protein
MRRVRLLLLGLLVLLLLALVAAGLILLPDAAVLAAIEGQVLVQRGGRGEFAAALQGDAVRSGDVIRTGRHSGVRVELSRGDRLRLQEQTEIVIRRLGRRPLRDSYRTVIEVRLGRVAAEVDEGRRQLDLVAPGGVVAAIRGTRLREAVDSERGARLAVDRGDVAFSSGGVEVAVAEGSGSAVRGGGAPLAPRPLLGGPEALFRQSELPWKAAFFRLRWDPPPGAQTQRVEVARLSDFSVLCDEQEGAEPGYDPERLDQPALYHVRVRGVDSDAIEGRSGSAFELAFDPDLYQGLRLLEAGDAPAAQARLTIAVERAPDDPLRWGELGWSHHLQAHWTQAVTAFERSLALDPQATRIRVRYARDLYWTGDLAGARGSFDQVLAANPRDADAWAGLAAVSRAEGDFAAALAAAQKALALDPAQEYAQDEIRRAQRRQRGP